MAAFFRCEKMEENKMADMQKIKEITDRIRQELKELQQNVTDIEGVATNTDLEALHNVLAELGETVGEANEQVEKHLQETSSQREEQVSEEPEVQAYQEELSAMKRAENHITQMEAEKTIFTEDERNLIVNYAYKMDSFEDARELAEQLAFYLENNPNFVAQTVINAQAEIEQLPDAGISLTELHEYGYTWEEMLPLTKERATELFEKDVEIYQLHVDGSETLIEDMEDIENHGGIFGVDKSQWGLYQEREKAAEVHWDTTDLEPEDQFLLGEQNQYGIFQLKSGDETRDYRFMGTDFLQKQGMEIDRQNYELVYTAPLTPDITLDGLYEKFNIDRPEDFKGHSLSVSDVIVLHQNGENTSHYVDSFGFTEIPEFHRYPTVEEQVAQEETVDFTEGAVAEAPIKEPQAEVPDRDKVSFYVIGDLATWANGSAERSALERFDQIDDAINQFKSYKGQIQEYSDDSARTTLGVSIGGKEFDLIHVRNQENYLVQDFTHVSDTLENDRFLDSLQILYFEVGFGKTRLHREMTPEEVKGFVKERFEHQLKQGGLEDVSVYLSRFDAVYEQGKMEHLMPTQNQKRITEDIPFTEWQNPYFMLNEVEELAVAVEDKFISIHKVEDGYDYTIYNADYREFDGGVYDNPDISIHTALDEIIADLKLTESQITGIGYDALSEKADQVEQQDISDKISEQVENNRIIDNFREKTRKHFHNIKGETPDDIENTVHAYVKSKIEEYEARAGIVGVVVAGSRCRGLEQADSDLDVIVEFSGNEREDDLFNLVHEDGLMIGGVKVDINPITAEKTGTLATYLPQVEEYLAEKAIAQQQEQEITAMKERAVQPIGQEVTKSTVQKEKETTVTMTVAECHEFHSVGEYHEGIKTVDEAVAAWKQIPPERLHGIPSIGVQIHTERTSEFEDTQWDIAVGKYIDFYSLSYVPAITDNLTAIKMIAELVEKLPEMEVRGSLESWIERQAEKIAEEVDQITYDYNPDEYMSQVEDREEYIQSMAADIKVGEAEYMGDFLNALIAEETREGVTDLFGRGMDTDHSEAIQNARKAKELLDKLAEYKPLAKVEELVEQNYNMIDNVLNNGAGEKAEKEERTKEQTVSKSSLKARLSQKQEQVSGHGKVCEEQENTKKNQREM